MSSYKSIKIDVSPAKARKIAAGKVVNLTATEVAGSDEVLHVHPENYAKLMKAKRAHKGCRLQLSEGEIEYDVMAGGNIFRKIWKGVKTLWKPVIKPALSLVADNLVPIASAYTGQPAIVSGARQALKELTGVGMPAKGSQAARDKMAKLRSMRKGGSRGGSFKL
jgi:hypothetical protein